MDKKGEQEFESLLDIDKYRLDDECQQQPHLVWDYGKVSAKAGKILDEAKSNLKVVEAEVDQVIRESPGDFDLPADKKPTENAIKAAVLTSKEYQQANKKVINATYDVNIVEAANKALDHRRTSLTTLDGQDARGYFSRPKQKNRTDTGDEFGGRKKRKK